MLPTNRELAALKFLDGLAAHLKDARETHKVLRHTLRDTRDFFRAEHGCMATLDTGSAAADLLFSLPKHATWDLDLLTRCIREPRTFVPRDMLVASLQRRGGAWGVIALLRPGVQCDREDRRLL